MIWEVRMPRLDEDMEEGTINRWIKDEGDFVNKGEPIVEIETQKVNYQIEAPGSGVLRLILVRKDDVVPINQVIAVIAGAEEDLSAYRKSSPQLTGKAAPVAEVSAAETADSSPVVSAETRSGISPIARKLAAEKGLDISTIQGTGPGGRITKEDVLNFQPQETSPPAPAAKRNPPNPAFFRNQENHSHPIVGQLA